MMESPESAIRLGASEAASTDAEPSAFPSWTGSSSREDMIKIQLIQNACSERDLQALRDLAATEGGLVEDQLRRTAWPLLLGCDQHQRVDLSDWTKLEKHRDEDQVQLDVDRSFVYYPNNEPESRKDARKIELSSLITATLRRHRSLHYFQGYHDIVQVLLLVLGADAAGPAVARLSLLRIRDFMLPTIAGTESHLHLLPAILYAADPQLCHHLSQTQPFFALAATLTLYAHEIEDYGQIARLFDFLLASEAVVPVYLFVAIVMTRKDELLGIDSDEPEMLGSILTKLPNPLDLESLISRASKLFQRHPPHRLPNRAWGRVSPNSVLKTTHEWGKLLEQTLQDGERLFDLQAEEIRRAHAWKVKRLELNRLAKRYKQPVRYAGAAALIAIIALVLRSNGAQLNEVTPVMWKLVAVPRKALELVRLFIV